MQHAANGRIAGTLYKLFEGRINKEGAHYLCRPLILLVGFVSAGLRRRDTMRPAHLAPVAYVATLTG